MTNDFRYNYAQFWLHILKADLDGIKIYADKLFQDPRVEKLYGLFACMVTGRSWRSIQKGIDKAEKNSAESQEIKDNVAKYMKEIADVLAFVNRQMILIFKTNDLLRNIEFSLGTQNRYIIVKKILLLALYNNLKIFLKFRYILNYYIFNYFPVKHHSYSTQKPVCKYLDKKKCEIVKPNGAD